MPASQDTVSEPSEASAASAAEDEEVFTPIALSFVNVAADTNVTLTLTSPQVSWSLGRSGLYAGGLELALDLEMPRTLATLEVSGAVLAVSTRKDLQSGARPVSFRLTLWLRGAPAVRQLKGFLRLNVDGRVRCRIAAEQEITWSSGVVDAIW